MRDNKESEERRNEFIETAEMLFKENGIMKTTVNSIVDELNVAKGLFYYYFKSKDDVIEAISEKYNKDFKQAIQKSFSQSDDYEERLKQFIHDTIYSFSILWKNVRGQNENIDLTILSTRSMDEAKHIASKVLKQLLEEGNELGKLTIQNVSYFADLLVGGMADLASKEDMDLTKIQELVEELIKKIGKEEE